jgi:hypothetical protein
MRDWKTTIPALLSAFFGFVLFKPQYFPPVVQDLSLYVFLGGLAVFGVYARQVGK